MASQVTNREGSARANTACCGPPGKLRQGHEGGYARHQCAGRGGGRLMLPHPSGAFFRHFSGFERFPFRRRVHAPIRK